MDKYFEIVKTIAAELNEIITDPEIDCSIAFLQSCIKKVKDAKKRNRLTNQVKYLMQKAETKTFDRSYAFPTLKHILESVILLIPETADRLCQEQGIPEFRFALPTDKTPEEIQKQEEERKARAADFYKKAKKKPKTDEEEKEVWEEVKNGIAGSVKEAWQAKLAGIETELEKKRIEHKMTFYDRMDYSKYETLSRMKGINDEHIQENIVLLRLDLDAELSPVQYEEIEVRGSIDKSKEAEEGSKDAKEELEYPKKIIKKLKERKVVNLQCLQEAKNTIQYLAERMADRILILGSLGPALGYHVPEYSLEPLAKAFKQVFDQEVAFNEKCEFDNFAQMLENNDIPEGSTVLLENVNFNPSEHGFSVSPENGQAKLTSKKQQEIYKERLGNYGKIYVNDAPLATLTEVTSICGIKAEHMILGLRMKDMINKISGFFMYSGYPFAAVLGGDDIVDKILLINSLIDTTTHIYLFGRLGLYFLSALGIKLSGFDHDASYYRAVHKVMAKAKENGVEIILPKDFWTVKRIERKQSIVEEKKEAEAVAVPAPAAAAAKVEAKKEAAKGAKKVGKVEEKKAAAVMAEEKKEEIKPRDEKAEREAKLEEERNLINEGLKNVKKATISEANIYEWFLLKSQKEAAAKAAANNANAGAAPAQVPAAPANAAGSAANAPPVPAAIPAPQKDPVAEFLPSDEWIIGYSDETIAQLRRALDKPLRLLWDGELDLKDRNDTKYLTRLMLDLLLKRKNEIPPHRKQRKLTLIHGAEAKDSITKIAEIVKQEEKEKLRKQRLAALQEDEDNEAEPEEPLEEEDKRGFDISTVCTDNLGDGPFTMKLMQGDYIPGLLNIEERPRPTRDELECDLSVLEDI